MKVAKLEDFGTQKMAAPKDRFEEYKRQCRALPMNHQAEFWVKAMRADPEVAKLTEYKVNPKVRP